MVLESRAALEDLHHAGPWISWTSIHTGADGTVCASDPQGAGGMDQFVSPYRAYSVWTYVPPYAFRVTDESFRICLLAFPPPLRGDTDDDGDVDHGDFAALLDCLTGPVQQVLNDACAAFDFDIVDLRSSSSTSAEGNSS